MKGKTIEEIYNFPQKCAEFLNLEYVTDFENGFSRKLLKNKVKYYNIRKKEITTPRTIERINKLRIPPAWEDIWIAPKSNFHIQATGIDQKQRKQYIYHHKWNEFRNLLKFYKIITVGKNLNKIQLKTDEHLKEKGLTRNKVLASIVKIIEDSYIRVGNEQYAKENSSYGITTLRKKHTEVESNTITFEFKGKSSKEHHIEIKDSKVAKIVEQLMKTPGLEVFKYEDENKNIVDIKSNDVNEYLREISGENITAKDFRTWAGTLMCFQQLKNYDTKMNKKEIKYALSCVFDHVADKLGNTKSVSRDYYIHPELIKTFENRQFQKKMDEIKKEIDDPEEENEALLLAFLRKFVEEELEEIIENEK